MEEEPYNLELCLAIGGGGLMPAEKLDDDCEEDEEEEEEEKRSTREDEHHKKLRCVVSEEECGNVNEGVRKKLKLDMEQLTLLEDTFKAHSHSMLSLRSKKEELAKKLNLRTRQVEVWFQNRRARTKMEKKKKDCEMLRKCCERLSSENQRLKMELQEMKSLNLTFPQCLSCEMIVKTSSSN